MKGFKNTGRGPKSGHSFSSKAGFSGSTGRTQQVRGYTRGVPGKKAFATGGMVVAKGTDGGSALTRRAKPVTGFDQEAGGKSPLRPGFSHGGKACYAEGGKVNTVGAAIRMVKELMKQGNSAGDAATKAARRYGVNRSDLTKPSNEGGGGLPADKQMLARGGMTSLGKNTISRLVTQAQAQQGRPAPQPVGMAPRAGRMGSLVGRAAGPLQQGFAPAPQGQKVPGPTHHGGYGSFGRRPVVG
jgi:hypothetical protein